MKEGKSGYNITNKIVIGQNFTFPDGDKYFLGRNINYICVLEIIG